MTHAEILLQEFDAEAKGTRTTLERVPASLGGYKPHDKSMPMGRLAMHVARLPSFGASILTLDKMDLATVKFPALDFESPEDTVRVFEQTSEDFRNQLAGRSNDDLERAWVMCFGEHVIAEGPRILSLRGIFFDHLLHHRAQLGVYLRLNDLPVPGLYGPSADDKMGI